MRMMVETIFGEQELIEGKICTHCKEFKTLDMYSFFNGSKASGTQNECIECRSKKKRMGEYFKKNYVIPHNHKCEICERTEEELVGRYNVTFVYDHDHTTEKLRGIICNDCNIGLGKFKDNPVLLAKATEYLEKNFDEKYLMSSYLNYTT